jgi:hypothetical protein
VISPAGYQQASPTSAFDLEKGSSVRQCHLDDLALAPRAHLQAAFLEDREHGAVAGQDFGNQFVEASLLSHRLEVPHQRSAYPLSLVFINDRESHLGPLRLNDDITSGAYNRPHAILVGYHNECDMIYEVDV